MKTTLVHFGAALLFLTLFFSCKHDHRPVPLFNGENLDGWIAVTDPEDTLGTAADVFTVKDGVIAISGRPFGYLRTEKTYGDYRVSLEFRWVGTGTNSGFFQRIQEGDRVWPLGMECQFGTGNVGDFIGLNGYQLSGAEPLFGPFTRKARTSETDPEKPAGEWNLIEVECVGKHVKYTVNGVLQNETDGQAEQGYIAIQSEGGPLEVRNIEITEL